MSKEKEFEDILKEIELLPKGNITYKVIRGKRRMYLQWYENHKKISKYIKAQDENEILLKIQKRDALNERLRALVESPSVFQSVVREEDASYGAKKEKAKYGDNRDDGSSFDYETNVITGPGLEELCRPVAGFGERDCLKGLKAYLQMRTNAKVCLVYGLRRTGKTTIVLQAISSLNFDETAYIKIIPTDSMAMLNRDLRKLRDRGISYVFIDEITLMSDFIDSASLLSDVFSSMGMKIVLSGTDSLGFALSVDEELYDRAYMIHTTFIPFREYERLLGIDDIDEYIRYGGTLRAGESLSDDRLLKEDMSFRDAESSRRYIDTAIARNIQHSLARYQGGTHFRHLLELYENNELTSAISRIIEDMNHRFLLSVLTDDFVSHDLGSARQLSRKRAAILGEEDILDGVDVDKITDRLREILNIRNKEEMSAQITGDHIEEIKEYLFLLDLIISCPSESIDSSNPIEQILFSQPGMRYCQAQALVQSVMKDETFAGYSAKERKSCCDKILQEVRGRMTEEIVLLETIKRLGSGQRAFKLLFPVGEIDMVVFDENECTCDLYEIKHSSTIVSEQYRHLVDKEKCKKIEFKYGDIKSKNVLYRGENTEVQGINYINITKYLLENV